MKKIKNPLAGIYQIRNLINNKIYVGSSKNLEQRKKEHFNSLRRKQHQPKLQNAYNKYGKENFVFEILEIVLESKEKLTDIEQRYLDILRPYEQKIGYNIARNGLGGDVFTNNPNKEETRKKLSNRPKEILKNQFTSPKLTPEEIQKNKDNVWKNKSEEFKQKQIKSLIDGQKKWRASLSEEEKKERDLRSNSCKKNTLHINNLLKEKFIYGYEIDKYLEQGWILGRLPYSKEHIKNISLAVQGRIHIYKDNVCKFIRSEDLDNFLVQGYELGRPPFNKLSHEEI